MPSCQPPPPFPHRRHQAPDGEIEAVTPTVITEALTDSVPRAPTMTAQAKQALIAQHLAATLKQVDEAIAAAPLELSPHALQNPRDALEHRIAGKQASLPAAEQGIAHALRSWLMDYRSETERNIANYEQEVKHWQTKKQPEYVKTTQDKLYQERLRLGQIMGLLNQLPSRVEPQEARKFGGPIKAPNWNCASTMRG